MGFQTNKSRESRIYILNVLILIYEILKNIVESLWGSEIWFIALQNQFGYGCWTFNGCVSSFPPEVSSKTIEGAAISLLDALSLKARIPGTEVTFYGYGLPRVGNQAFANYVDASLSSFTRITNLNDPIPIVPFEILTYHHPCL